MQPVSFAWDAEAQGLKERRRVPLHWGAQEGPGAVDGEQHYSVSARGREVKLTVG